MDGTTDSRSEMSAKLKTDAGRAVYARRKAIVEPVFGNIKEARGFRPFSLRGITKVRSEWALVCTAHNLLKLFKSKPLKPTVDISSMAPWQEEALEQHALSPS